MPFWKMYYVMFLLSWLERKYYYGKREASRKSPEQYLSLIIDGMDQAKTNLPHFIGRKPKNMNGADLLKTHITGVLNHGHGGFHTYVDIGQYSHDPNMTINVLLKALLRTSISMNNRLPPVLFIQADNCWRENKNRFVLSFCELLVRRKIFDEVHLSFLYVGHTHEDVDSAFSKISERLKKNDAETLNDLLKLLPNTELLNKMYDVKSWIAHAISDISGVSQPLHYKFERVAQGINVLYKGQHSQPWEKLHSTILKYCPDGQPPLLDQDFKNIDCKRQLSQVENLSTMYKNPASLGIWKKFCSDIANRMFMESGSPAAEWILDILPTRYTYAALDDQVIPEVIQLIEKETQVPQVRLRKK